MGVLTYFVVPILDGKRMGYGKPIPMDVEIGGFTARVEHSPHSRPRVQFLTYYAGKSKTFKAVATTAHCAIVG